MNKTHRTNRHPQHIPHTLRPVVVAVTTALGVSGLLAGCGGGGGGNHGGGAAPDLTITKSHAGSFTQGQTGAQYTLTVTNSGSASTSGTVTVTDTLPPDGLTATNISGTGWTCALNTLSCTRSDALAAGESYPDLTLTVDVDDTAPDSVTNKATIEGGGETNTANNTARDVTSIRTPSSGGSVYLYAAAANTKIEVLNDTSTGPGGVPSSPNLGATPLNISGDTTIPIANPADPSVPAYFQNAGDCHVYQSNGDGDPTNDTPVTGVSIDGAKLTLQDNKGAIGCIEVANDIANDGTITTETQGASVALYVDSYFGGGGITTSGAATNPDAGDIAIHAQASIYNEGPLEAKGAPGNTPSGGNGGDIFLYASGTDLWNSGSLDTSGGTSAGGQGGNGGEVDLHLDVTNTGGGGSLRSDASILTRGGDGDTGGGNGGYVYLYLNGPAAGNGVEPNNIYVTEDIDSRGGDVTGSGKGGTGGDISMTIEAEGGSLELQGFSDIVATGGEAGGIRAAAVIGNSLRTSGGTGETIAGAGGDVFLFSDINDADITNEANIDTSGGNATVLGFGGAAGAIGASIGLYQASGAGAVGDINNTGDLRANGGSGSERGGDGGYISLYAWSDGKANAFDKVYNGGALTSRGGDAENGQAGDGGFAGMGIGHADGIVDNSGSIDTSGGKSTAGDGGSGGGVYVGLYFPLTDNAENAVNNVASITTDGGNGANGGDAGNVLFGAAIDFYSSNPGPGAKASNTGSISGRGGGGSNGDGGSGSFYVGMIGEPLTNHADINVSGGDGTVNGGDGGKVFMYSTGGTSTDNDGSVVTISGGSGGTGIDGTDGTFLKDGVPQ